MAPDRPEEEDPVDAEFTDVDDDGPHRPQTTAPNHERPWGSVVFLICLVGMVLYWMFGRGESAKQAGQWPPGWEDLLDCSYTVSLNGTKELNLFDNHRAVLYDKSVKKNGKYLTTDGNWTFDKATQLYAISFNGELTSYSLVEPEGSADVCMLAKGDLSATDLNASWFAKAYDQTDADPDH